MFGQKFFPFRHLSMIKLNIKQESRVALTLDGGRYHIETSPLICRANQWIGFYMITASAMKELTQYGWDM